MNRNLSLRTFSFKSSAASLVGTSPEFTAFGSGPYAKRSKASAFFFLPTTMVFATVLTHFPRKNTRVYRISRSRNRRVTRLTRATSNRVEVHIA